MFQHIWSMYSWNQYHVQERPNDGSLSTLLWTIHDSIIHATNVYWVCISWSTDETQRLCCILWVLLFKLGMKNFTNDYSTNTNFFLKCIYVYLFIYFMCVSFCLGMHVYALVCLVLEVTRRGIWCPGTRNTNGWELPCSARMQHGLSTRAPGVLNCWATSPAPPTSFFWINSSKHKWRN